MKKLKWVLLVIALLLVMIAAYVLYEFKFKTYEIDDTEVDAIVKEQYELDLPISLETEITEDVKEIYVEDNLVLIAQNNKIIAVKDSSGKEIQHVTYHKDMVVKEIDEKHTEIIDEKGDVVNTVDPKPTEAAIKQKYTPTIESLEKQAEARVNTLINHAKQEYNDKKQAGEKVSVGYFYTKYMESSKALESSTDEVFETLMSNIENELTQHGYSKEAAQELKIQYEAQKESLRASIKTKALVALK